MIDQPRSITGKAACIKFLVGCQPLHIFPRGRTGIEVAKPFIIREEGDTLADPAGISHIASDMQEPLKGAAALRIAPQVPNSSTAIPFPSRHIPDVTTKHDSSLWFVGNRVS